MPLGRVRLFKDLRKVRDTITDDLACGYSHPTHAATYFPFPMSAPRGHGDQHHVDRMQVGLWKPTLGIRFVAALQPAGHDRSGADSALALHSAVNQAEYQLNLRQISTSPAGGIYTKNPSPAADLSREWSRLHVYPYPAVAAVKGLEYGILSATQPTSPGGRLTCRRRDTAQQRIEYWAADLQHYRTAGNAATSRSRNWMAPAAL